MKKSLLILIITSVIFLTSCSTGYIMNIDSFCERYNKLSKEKLERINFMSAESGGSLSSYYVIDNNILINVSSDKSSMNIKSISVTTPDYSKKYYDVIKNTTLALYDEEKDNTLKCIDEVMKDKEKEYANEMHTLKYITLIYTKTKSGHRFEIRYNEEIPTETTVVPETAKQFDYKVTSSPSSPLCVYYPFRQQYMCCQAERSDFS